MDLILPVIFTITPIDRSCYIVINTSILQDFFFSVTNVVMQYRKTLRVSKITKEMKIHILMICYVMRLIQNQKNAVNSIL